MSPGYRLRAMVCRPDFRRLYITRLISQFSDGVFQASLAGTILFNPDRHSDPLAIAFGFAILLLPYSLIGPFVGIVLDRWSRRDVLVVTNLCRTLIIPFIAVMIWMGTASILFLLLALLVVGIGRFYAAGLSAALPHVVEDEHLVSANSISTTSGSIAYAIGIGCALGLQSLIGSDNHSYGLIILCAVIGYFAAAGIAARFSYTQLGPDHFQHTKTTRITDKVRTVAHDFRAGAHHLLTRRFARTAMLAACLQRICYGASALMLLLLYRNYFTSSGIFRTHEAGLGQVVLASAAGALIAAALTPMANRRWGARRWITGLLTTAAVVLVVLGLPFALAPLLVAVFIIGLVSQGIKIVADSSLQHECDDDYRGRAFSVYDMLFNVCYVIGAIAAALFLPENGKSYAMVLGMAGGYALLAVWYHWAASRGSHTQNSNPDIQKSQLDKQAPEPAGTQSS